ncbi:GntR family transcriptional regulator [Propionibacterium acidifaciens]|uniref:GntR family transcriptional regulator n=1 Tax=Propionibacterium acidifaciens TaxID=556499 RepID=UPI001D033BF5|nr:GntR family transcriptional regulator [Propionibacterium acidifaciens]
MRPQSDSTSLNSTAPGARLQRKVLRDDVYDAILELLMSGEITPGTSLGIDPLARRLGVSPTPVREAMVQLEGTGLVERTALRGYRVADPLTAAQLAEIIDARVILETGAIERAFRSIDALLPPLTEALQAHRTQAEALNERKDLDYPSLQRYFNADWNFHHVILEHCGNRYLREATERLAFSTHRMRQLAGHRSVSDGDQAVAEHTAILEAIRTRDVSTARQAMQNHLAAVAERTIG